MAAIPATSATKWLTFFADQSLLDDDAVAKDLWAAQQQQQLQRGCSAECSADNGGLKLTAVEDDESPGRGISSKKRIREDVGKDSGCSKANREKMRRDRLNDRFLELGRVLEEDGKPPKTDKATILCDAVRVIGQLRHDAASLKEGNELLKEQIKELKAEKNELREEKARLKEEKERLEQQVKSISYQPSFSQHPAAMHTAATLASRAHTGFPAKLAPAPTVAAPVAMWQWLPPAAVDTSQDHVLRPPVA